MSRRPDRNQTGRARAELPVKLTIMERIRKETEPEMLTPASSVRRYDPLKKSISRNLSWMLNSRRVLPLPDESLLELNKSMYVYGVHDLAGTSIESPREHSRLKTEIADLIGIFEPRLTDISIEKPERLGIGTLRFHINGLMLSDQPERISFGIELNSSSGEYAVKDSDNAG